MGLWDLRCAPPRWYQTMLCTTALGPTSVRRWQRTYTSSALAWTYINLSIFVVNNEHANQGSQCSSVPMYTLVVRKVPFYRLGGAQDDFACSFFYGVQCSVVSLSGFVEPTLCTTSMVQNYVVHHQPALCTTNLWQIRITKVVQHMGGIRKAS